MKRRAVRPYRAYKLSVARICDHQFTAAAVDTGSDAVVSLELVPVSVSQRSHILRIARAEIAGLAYRAASVLRIDGGSYAYLTVASIPNDHMQEMICVIGAG
jgi:hypothetical protein